MSVMGDATTAMRDPIFYRWHAFIDDIFQTYKSTLPGYTTENVEMKIFISMIFLVLIFIVYTLVVFQKRTSTKCRGNSSVITAK